VHTFVKKGNLCLAVITDDITKTRRYGEPPYETMVFPAMNDAYGVKSHVESFSAWYDTETEAVIGHFEVVNQLVQGNQPQTSERDAVRKDIIFAKHELEEDDEE
jgi:hypothetical protein